MYNVFIFGKENIHTNYLNAFKRLNCNVTMSYDVKKSQNCDALVLCGGGDVHPHLYGETLDFCQDVDLERDLKELSLTEKFTSSKRLILGICRGMQLVNVFFKGSLEKKINSFVEHKQINGKDSLHKIICTQNSVLYKNFGKELTVNSAHRQAVKNLGSGLIIECITKDGVIEAVRHSTLPIYLTQFHPERLYGTCPNGIEILQAVTSFYL